MKRVIDLDYFELNDNYIENPKMVRKFVYGKKNIILERKDTNFCRISFEGKCTRSGGYLLINGKHALSVNSTAIMPVFTPVSLELTLVVSAESSLTYRNIIIEELQEKVYLEEQLNEIADILVISPDYPSYINLYYCAFVHTRNLEYHSAGIKFQAVAISVNNWFETLYEIDGIKILQGEYHLLARILRRKKYKCIIVHFVDERILSIFDQYLDDSVQLIFICHGPETTYRYLKKVIRPYSSECVSAAGVSENFINKDYYIKKYSQKDNVEWVFVSEWLKLFSENEQGVIFKNSMVISSCINEQRFPYVCKTPEDRKKIVIVRKFDNIRVHSLDQSMKAILELSKRDYFNQLTFDVYGDGDYYDQLVTMVKHLKNVHLHRTFVPNDKLAEIYRKEGIMLLPSRHDTQGISMGEAAASGLVVIGSKVTCLPEFMREEIFHTLADPEDPIELADIIERFYKNPKLFLETSKNMSAFIRKKFGRKQTIEREIDIIKEKIDMNRENNTNNSKNEFPVLSILIPIYNTEKYLRRCLDSIFVSEVLNDIEIIAVNDGGKDSSIDILKEYQVRYPQCLIVIDKENGGHGSTINVGLKQAKGRYFRVLDSDDWFNSIDFTKFVNRLKDEEADLVVCDYRKEHTYNSKSEIFAYKNLNDRKLYKFDDFDLKILEGEYFVMATSTYKTEVLRKSGLKLLEKTFYVDMQYNVVPITNVNTFTYYKLDIYRYFIGRKEQSMNMDNFVRNQDHHKKMIKWLIEYYTHIADTLSLNKKEYIETILTYTLNTHYSIYCEYDKNHKRAYKEVVDFDKYLLETNAKLYDRINCMAYVRYNRKTKFRFVRLNGSKWYTVMKIARKLKRG